MVPNANTRVTPEVTSPTTKPILTFRNISTPRKEGDVVEAGMLRNNLALNFVPTKRAPADNVEATEVVYHLKMPDEGLLGGSPLPAGEFCSAGILSAGHGGWGREHKMYSPS